VGELLIRPKVPGCFSAGYYKMPERTVEAWRNLWFHTGDACRKDEKGRFHYVDRIKDCIRRRGENISAFEVEQVLNAHPLVAESAVVGVKADDAGGEQEVMAVIVPEPGGRRVDEVALLDYCAGRMPRFAVPRFVQFVGELDKTASGKLRKGDLRDAGVTAKTWDRESVGYVVARS
jgi:crotonobetaine/carnitine-CoA ligase